jgi:hypothetical protein
MLQIRFSAKLYGKRYKRIVFFNIRNMTDFLRAIVTFFSSIQAIENCFLKTGFAANRGNDVD